MRLSWLLRQARRGAAHPWRFARAVVWRKRFRNGKRDHPPRVLRYRGCSFALYPDEEVAWSIINDGGFEEAEMECLLPLVRPGDLCVDVGANAGLYTIQMAKRGADVLAFEPLPRYQDLLRRNAAVNGVSIEIIPRAAANASGVTSFSVAADGGFSSLRPTGRQPEVRRESVGCTTLDAELLQRGRSGGVWKVDVEGAELLVLRGGAEVLARPDLRPRAVLVELNAQNQAAYGYGPDAVVKFLRNLDYEPHAITAAGPVPGWPAQGVAEDVLFVHTVRST